MKSSDRLSVDSADINDIKQYAVRIDGEIVALYDRAYQAMQHVWALEEMMDEDGRLPFEQENIDRAEHKCLEPMD